MTESGGFRPLSEKSIHAIQFKLGMCTYWGSVQNWFGFGPCWRIFGPLVATKWLKMVVSDHYLKKYSCNPVQIWCLHALGECSELIDFWALLAQFWPSNGHKMAKNGGFRLLSEKVFTQYNSNLVPTLVGWVFTIDFGSCCPNFGLLVTKKMMKMMVSDHYLKKYHYVEWSWLFDLFKKWCSHWLEGSSQMIQSFNFLLHRPNLALWWPPLYFHSFRLGLRFTAQVGACVL